ncbi:MAG: energy-coupling factor ABC transporter ATP-binding protein [Lachnospiraceae bacterium]|nr:energy-coupling factor ABC transporter ATP-binding protein [Lachnospiraceae bacterium]
MIELKNVSFKYGSDKKRDYNLSDISLRIKAGECVVVTGESGCGKTTLTRVLNGLCPNYFEGTISGAYILNGETVFSSDEGKPIDIDEDYEKSLDDIGMLAGNVFQDPRSQFFSINTTDEIVLAMENRNFTRERMNERLKEIDDLMGIEKLLDKNLFKLSSGEKQKVAIAAACSVEPKVLIMDEPSANLDTEGTVQLRELLKKLKTKGYTIVISEHRMGYLKELADRMIVMRAGRIEKIFEAGDYNRLSDDEMIKMGLRVLSEIPEFVPTGRKIGDSPVLIVDNIRFKRGKKEILNSFSASFYRGEITAITGENGVGKTTLCRIIAGELRQQKGSVRIFGETIQAGKRIRDCFFVGQDADYQIFTPTVLQEVTLNTDLDGDEKEVEDILNRFDLWEYRRRHPASLSGGQKQRVILAAALLRNNPILILDEPTSGLDGRHMRVIAEYLRNVAVNGTCILVITHDREFINIVADKVLNMK